MVVFEQSGCIRAKVVVFGKKCLYSGKKWLYSEGKSGFIRRNRAKWLSSGKVVVFGKKWLYSGKLVVFALILAEMWLYSGKSGCIRAKLVVIRVEVVVFSVKKRL